MVFQLLCVGWRALWASHSGLGLILFAAFVVLRCSPLAIDSFCGLHSLAWWAVSLVRLKLKGNITKSFTAWSFASVHVVMLLSVGLLHVHPQLLLRQDRRRTVLAYFLAFCGSFGSCFWRLWWSLQLGGHCAFAVVLVASILSGLSSLGRLVVVTLVELAAAVVSLLFSMVDLG